MMFSLIDHHPRQREEIEWVDSAPYTVWKMVDDARTCAQVAPARREVSESKGQAHQNAKDTVRFDLLLC